ncbi:DUF6542 domain-containing protein [Streptomyces sp. NPDC101112]|uniref:DUF6542 domain-containing protein n=1 Tax=Streptomyces sp. NPDC101112 TaxID=3366105 RepID=UPI0037FACE7B
MPNPRLTGLGGGLFCAVSMFALACLDRLLFGASLTLYGVLFLPVSALTAVWVRRGDLTSGPVVVPIAFAAGLPPIAGGEGGPAGYLMGLVTALAMAAGWLYGGTLIAGLIVTARKLRLMARRAAEREWETAGARRGGRTGEREAATSRGSEAFREAAASGGEEAPRGAAASRGVEAPRGVAAPGRTEAFREAAASRGSEAPRGLGRTGTPGAQPHPSYDHAPARPRTPRPPAQPRRTVPRSS